MYNMNTIHIVYNKYQMFLCVFPIVFILSNILTAFIDKYFNNYDLCKYYDIICNVIITYKRWRFIILIYDNMFGTKIQSILLMFNA